MIPFQLHRRIPLLRRPFHQRDRAMEQRDQLRAERDHAIAERDLAVRETERLRGEFIETANATLPATPFGRPSMPELVDPRGLIARIIAAYRASTAATTVRSAGVWDSEIFKMKRDIHDALFAADQTATQTLLRDPGKTDLFYGFDIPARSWPTDDSKFALDGLGRYRELLLLSEVL